MNINFKKLTPTAITPVRAHATDAGFDLFASEDKIIKKGYTKVVSTGIALELPDGYFADVRPRSGLTSKTFLRVHYGTIDSSYRGDIGIICENANHIDNHGVNRDTTIRIKEGDKIGQLVIQKLPDIKLVEANELKESDRGVNGFGSTDKKEE